MRARLPALLATLVCLAACGPALARSPQGSGTATPRGDATATSPSAPAGGSTPRPGETQATRPSAPGGAPAPAPGQPRPGPTAGSAPQADSRDSGNVGDMSRAFLRPAPYTSIAVEVDVAGNAAPDASVIGDLTGTLGREAQKPVTQRGGHTFAGKGSNGCWSDNDISAATNQQRRTYSAGATAALFVMYLDGTYCPDAHVIGMAYAGSDMLVFTAAVENVSISPTVGPVPYEKAVTIHELGHILALVNIGYQSSINHEDPSHPHHSSDPNSVMYYAIDQDKVFQQFVSGPPQTFDSADESDLAGLRSGTY